MIVKDDFEENDDYSKLIKTVGILKAGVKKTFEVEEGKQYTFGSDPLCDFVIPLGEEIDPYQFSIYNKNGKLFIIDRSDEKHQTKILVDQEQGMRLNQGDFIDVGL